MIFFNKIIDNIFIGTCPTHLVDVRRLKQAGITAVLNLQSEIDFDKLKINWSLMEQYYQQSGIAVYRINIVDFDDDDLANNLPRAAQTLEGMIDIGHCVYVHCTAGMQRSPSAVIGYLAWNRNFGLEEAIKLVLAQRDCDPPISVLQTMDALMNQDR